MWGAIIGDLTGSVYEFGQIKKVSPVMVGELITEDSFYTDDTILTIAIYDAILNNTFDYDGALRRYGTLFQFHKPINPKYGAPPGTFSKGFMNYLDGTGDCKSMGNGAMMRISGVGKMFNTLEDVMDNARRATIPSHNTRAAVECAQIIAQTIFFARMGERKQWIRDRLGFTTMVYQPFESFNRTCYETMNNCMFAVFESDNFEEAIRKVLSFGGDTDTNCAIVGAMAEALYGVPEFFVKQARKKIPESFVHILDEAYAYA